MGSVARPDLRHCWYGPERDVTQRRLLFLFLAFVVRTIGLSALFTWLSKLAGGNLLVIILFHAAVNTAVFLPTFFHVKSGTVPLLNAGLAWVAAILVSRTSCSDKIGKPYPLIHIGGSI